MALQQLLLTNLLTHLLLSSTSPQLLVPASRLQLKKSLWQHRWQQQHQQLQQQCASESAVRLCMSSAPAARGWHSSF